MRFKKISLIILLNCIYSAWAVDLQPNDIIAPLPGKNYVTISYLNTENDTFYQNGSVVRSKPFTSPVITGQAAQLRLSTTYEIEDLPSVSYIQLPYGTLKPSGSLSAYSSGTGTGDLVFATAIWPYSDRQARRYLGLAGYLIAPTGSYNSQQAFNLGENRWKADIQMGYQQPIITNLDGMIAIDTMWFSTNNQCAAACFSASNTSLSQKPLTTTQLGPILKIDQTYTLGASYFYVAGGATTIGNTYQNNTVNTQRYLLSAVAHYPIGRITLQYGRDMEITNGFFESRRLALRYQREF
jgi:Putative MetA-pathway of phenol degradation